MDYYYALNKFDWFSGSIELALAFTALLKVPLNSIKLSFFCCALLSSLWHISLPTTQEYSIAASNVLLWLEGLRYLTWSLLLINLLMLSRGEKLPRFWRYILHASIGLFIVLLVMSVSKSLTISSEGSWYSYIKILFCLFNIMLCEQLIRHDHSGRMTKLVALIALTIFSYDIFVFSNLILFSEINNDIWYARGFISTATALMLALSIIFYAQQLTERSKFKLSNSVILFNTSLTLVGSFLILIALISSILNFFAISWVNATTIMFYVMTLLTIIILSFSENIRQHIVVFTSKHFFSHKYDYKKQWVKLDSLLSNTSNNANCYDKSLNSISTQFACSSGGLWLKGSNFYSLVAQHNLQISVDIALEHNHSQFIQTMTEQDWIFQVCQHASTLDSQYNALLPDWLGLIKNTWIVVPLNTDEQLIGFFILCKDKLSSRLTWEDLDLLKLTGGQIASYISHHQAAEQLQHNKQFAMFNKITAFAIHDVKNLIAQQALVVKNAEKHKHNPEFIDDAITTIANSVDKMDQLLLKLQGKSQNTDESVNLNLLLTEAIEMNENTQPIPSLSSSSPEARIKTDKNKLLMVLNHLITNAQDATAESGSIKITLNSNDDMICLEVRDTGVGMDADFINNKLFQPFTSTKNQHGMGIGAYQIRELIHSLNGELLVESRVNIGSKFSIYLPVTAEQSMDI